MALLASAIPGGKLPLPEPRYWTSHIGADGVSSQRRFPAADTLEALVRQHAGVFPVFLLTEDWPEAEQAKLCSEYIEWISPSLLTLQHLDRRERERMENSLNVQAVSVEHHWHLYPEIINVNRINAARVRCRLQKANPGRSSMR